MVNKKILILAGGTGGHIFPGLVVAHHLIQRGWSVRWLGTRNRMEADIVPKHGIKIDFINLSKIRHKGFKGFVLSTLNLLYTWSQAYLIVKSYKPNVILSMGSYISAAGGLAAWSSGVPLLVHEQNTICGRTNKLLSLIAKKNMQGLPGSFVNSELVGNPLRNSILNIASPDIRLRNRTGLIRILILGGSQGSNIMNQIIPPVVAPLINEEVCVWHQVGKNNLEYTTKLYCQNNAKLGYTLNSFINNIAAAYSWADLVICRSGALTVSELSFIGLAAIFIPVPHADKHQYWNANLLKKVGAAEIIPQDQFNAQTLSNMLRQLNRKKLFAMSMRSNRNIKLPHYAISRIIHNITAAAK